MHGIIRNTSNISGQVGRLCHITSDKGKEIITIDSDSLHDNNTLAYEVDRHIFFDGFRETVVGCVKILPLINTDAYAIANIILFADSDIASGIKGQATPCGTKISGSAFLTENDASRVRPATAIV
ncbi:MAG: hypothetical protein Kow00105_17850 [Phycisphaeraceae bacterium]